MNTGPECQHMRQLAVLQSIFETPENLLVCGFRLSLVPCESPSHGEPLWFSTGLVHFLSGFFPNVQFHMILLNLSSMTQPVSADVFPKQFCVHFLLFFNWVHLIYGHTKYVHLNFYALKLIKMGSNLIRQNMHDHSN